MRVAFLIHSMEVSGCRYRVLQYLPYLQGQGVETSIHLFPKRASDKLKLYRSLARYDLFFVHRRLFPPVEFWYLRRQAKRIVFDFDDAIMYRSSRSRNPYSLSRRIKFGYMIRRMDYIIAGNAFLKSEVLPYNPKVEVIPTSIELSQYGEGDSETKKGPVTVGWIGSHSTLQYLEGLMPILERIYEVCPHFQLKIVCDQFLESPSVPVIKKAWSAKDEEADLRSFDIGLMPLTDDPWSRGKCGLKILQYSTVGVPVVCSPVGVNRDLVRDGVNGFWATHEGEWKEKLLCLIREEKLRREMGERGRRLVEEGYTVNVNAPRIYALLKMVCREGKGA